MTARVPSRKGRAAARSAPVAGYSGKSTLDKLGARPGMKVAALGLDSERAFLAELRAQVADLKTDRPARGTDMVIVRVDAGSALTRLAKLEAIIRPNGAIWVVWPKGQAHIKEGMIREAALALGLVDVKVCAFSETLSALKLVIPVARR